VRSQLFYREVADRLPQLFVLVGEDEVFLLALEVGLQDGLSGGGHWGAFSLIVKGCVRRERACMPSGGAKTL
jgi:hypothetical protein